MGKKKKKKGVKKKRPFVTKKKKGMRRNRGYGYGEGEYDFGYGMGEYEDCYGMGEEEDGYGYGEGEYGYGEGECSDSDESDREPYGKRMWHKDHVYFYRQPSFLKHAPLLIPNIKPKQVHEKQMKAVFEVDASSNHFNF